MKSRARLGTIVATILIIILIAIGLGIWLYSTRTTSTQPEVTIPSSPSIATEEVRGGFASPTDIASIPGSSESRLFVTERSGIIRSIDPSDRETEPQIFLDIQQKIQAGGEMGLLGLAFHPDYQTNGYLFVNYINKERATVVARYQVPEGSNTVDSSTEKIILTLPQPYENHNGGDLAFGSDGYLYISSGDGGSAGDPGNRAQDRNSLLGKILRIDINTDEPYRIPDTNPFVGHAGAKPEIWAYGLRNPWRISFDAQTHDFYIADVGQGNLEEIDFQPAGSKGGENYGWRCFEGTRSYNPEGCQETADYHPPIVEYDHSNGRCSVTGGFVYRGEAISSLAGKYVYGDFCSGEIFYAHKNGNEWRQTRTLDTSYSISTFGEGSDNELYFADFETGNLYKIIAAR